MREILFRLEKAVGGALLAVLAATIFIQVLSRYVLDFPLAWSEEVSRYSFIWLTMIVAPICIRKNANLGIDVLTKDLPQPTALVLQVITHVLVIILASVFVLWGAGILEVVKYQRSPAMGIPMNWIYAAIPVGGMLMIVELLFALNACIRRLTSMLRE